MDVPFFGFRRVVRGMEQATSSEEGCLSDPSLADIIIAVVLGKDVSS